MPNLVEAGSSHVPRYAVVFKTHTWDGFILRQFQRYRDAPRTGDAFIVADETNGPIGPIEHDRVLRATDADLIAMGLADRAERGSLIWWNTDYPHYLFASKFPQYDYYLFVEYDTVINCEIDELIRCVSAAGADFVALPTRCSKLDWQWTWHHLATYDFDSIEGSLNCISICSNRALRHFMQRRLEMSRQSSAGEIAFWPCNEVFLATEAKMANLKMASLSEFGNADGYEWYPPYLEEDLEDFRDLTFLHPVLDEPRYMTSILRFSWLTDYFSRGSRLAGALKRFPKYKPLVARAFCRRLVFRTHERWQNAIAKFRVRPATLLSHRFAKPATMNRS
ncbi:hypothetical protein [Roseomonas chloroacetimidivorans]|uniref:hypothetical protein n=1 Tax=Roseomonas chloroacetimidivorans TaxID=1766656 RepID=UPI003C717A3B